MTLHEHSAPPYLPAASVTHWQAQNCSRGAELSQLDPSFCAPRDLPRQRVKFLCSHGGKILPRPSDWKLRYVGGQTRIFSVPRHIHYAGFLSKMMDIYGQNLTLKYQLPDEDLDALVSVFCDDDLENMMEECDRLDSCTGLSKLRVFVFSPSELVDAANLSDMFDNRILEQRYVDAVNELLPEPFFRRQNDHVIPDSRKNSDGDDAFAWSGISNSLSGNAQSEAKLAATENALLSETRLPEDAVGASSCPYAPSHPASTRQPAQVETAPELNLDRFANALKELTLHQNEDDHAHGVEHRCVAEVRDNQGASHSLAHVTVAREKLQRGESMDSQNNRLELASADGNERSDDQLCTELPLSTSDLQQKQRQPDSDEIGIPIGDKIAVMDLPQKPPRNISFRKKQAFPVEEQQPPQQLLFCNPLATFDQNSVVPGQIDEYFPEDSSGGQNLFRAEAQPVLQQSTSLFQTSGSAPSSPIRETMKGIGKPGAFPLEGHLHQTPTGVSVQDFPIILYDHDDSCKNDAACSNSGHPSWSLLNPEKTSHEKLMDPYRLGQKLVDVGDLHFDGLPLLTCSGAIHNQQTGLSSFQNHEDADAFSKRLQSPCLSLLEESFSTANLAATNTYAAVQSENEHLQTSGLIPLALLPCAVVGGDIPAVGRAMVSEHLQSSQLTKWLPADMLVADMSTSLSLGSSFEPCPGRDDFRGREKIEPTAGKISVIEPTLTAQRISEEKSFVSAQCSVSSREQFDKKSCHFDEDMDLDDAKSLESFVETMATAVNPSDFLTPPLLAATWETSVFQAEHMHCFLKEDISKEQGLEGLGLAMENELTHEDLNLEIEELDQFESLPDQTSNAAVLAEKEAISRGLQTIKNMDLEELRELGSGTFGTVYHGKWRGTDVAIKRIKSSCFTGRQSERERLIADFWREAYILGQLHHPNVVAFYGVVPDGPGATLATVTEFMVNGSLKQVLQKKDRTLDHHKRLLIAMDAAFGMEYLHGKNVVHFDIKCENLLVNLRDTQRPICKVGDLGLSKVKQQTMVSGGVRGTLPWMAPELLNGTSSMVSEKVDVFSFGIVLWELLTGEEPYANMHYGAIIGGIVNNTLRPPIPAGCDHAWRSLMEKCWSAYPTERPTFTQIAGKLRMMEGSLNAKGQGLGPTAGSYDYDDSLDRVQLKPKGQ